MFIGLLFPDSVVLFFPRFHDSAACKGGSYGCRFVMYGEWEKKMSFVFRAAF